MPKRLQVTIGDRSWTAEVAGMRVTLHPGDVRFDLSETDGRLLASGHRTVEGIAAVAGDAVWVAIGAEVFAADVRAGATRHRSATRDHDALAPPMAATVVRIAVRPGDTVRDGDLLVALEAMKMELPIRAHRDGRVRAVHCREGDLVHPDSVLIDLE